MNRSHETLNAEELEALEHIGEGYCLFCTKKISSNAYYCNEDCENKFSGKPELDQTECDHGFDEGFMDIEQWRTFKEGDYDCLQLICMCWHCGKHFMHETKKHIVPEQQMVNTVNGMEGT